MLRSRTVLMLAVAACLAAGPATRPSVDQQIDQLLAPPTLPALGQPAAGGPSASQKLMSQPSTVQPVTGGATSRPVATMKVVREGTQVVDQTGWIGHTADGGTAVFTFDTPTGDRGAVAYPPMIVLPDLELEAMERRQAAVGGGPMSFLVSGLVTEYRGRAYLRIDRSMDASVTDVGGRPPPLPTGLATDRTSGRAAVAPGAPSVPVLREGTQVVDQLARLNRSADGRTDTLTFDADAKTMRDPPMILLQNLRLFTMEQQQAALAKDVKFRVSGSVTEYRGRNYLLVEKAVIVQDFDADF